MSAIDPERQEKARDYARSSRWLWLLNVVLSAGYAIAWLALGWSVAVRSWLVGALPVLVNPWLLVPAFGFALAAPFMLIDMPLSYYAGFALPHRYGQSTQTLKDWIGDQAKGLLIGACVGLVLLELLYLALRLTGAMWWLWAAGGLLVFNVLLANLAPILIMPLFNKYTPLGQEHQGLERRLLRLAEKARTRVRGVYKFDLSRRTKAANAALTGIGNSRRIILGDTMINEFTPDEVETVLAHELGHHVHRDLLVYIAVGSFVTMVGLYVASAAMAWAVAAFGFAGVSDPAALPALAVILGAYGMVTLPLENALSRWRERMADAYALEATGSGEAFASALVRLANQNLSEVDPARWVVWIFYSHPPLGERIAAARGWSGLRPSSRP